MQDLSGSTANATRKEGRLKSSLASLQKLEIFCACTSCTAMIQSNGPNFLVPKMQLDKKHACQLPARFDKTSDLTMIWKIVVSETEI